MMREPQRCPQQEHGKDQPGRRYSIDWFNSIPVPGADVRTPIVLAALSGLESIQCHCHRRRDPAIEPCAWKGDEVPVAQGPSPF
jgi:hypothetical protein